jgi:peptide/nickel transport system substrate-binding protein
MIRPRDLLTVWITFFGILLLLLPLFTTLPTASFTSVQQKVQPPSVQKEVNQPKVGTLREAKGDFIEGTSGADAETLNRILTADATSFSYYDYAVDPLATYDNEFNIQLRCLAKDIEVSDDGLVYTVTIRDDLKWSNGSPITAEDYVYTLKNLMFSDWLNYPYRSDWQEDVNGKKVFVIPEVVNDTTFTITRQTVNPEFVYTIYDLYPYPEYIAAKYEGDVKAFTEAPELNNLDYTGNLGPYRFKEWNRNDKYVVERNPDYYLGKDNGAPYFDQYIVKIFGTPATRQAALEAGDITYTTIEPDQANRFRNMENIKVYTIPSGSCTILAFNQRNNGWEGLRQQSVRQALAMAINKDVITQSIMLGFAEPAFSFIPSISPWYDQNGLVKYGVGDLYDKNKAAEMLYDEGYGVKQADGNIKVTNKDGSPLHLVLVTTQGSNVSQNIVLQVRRELLSLGIETETKFVPWSTLIRQYMENKVPGVEQEPRDNNGPEAVSQQSWDMLLLGFGSDVLQPSGSYVFYDTEGGLNFMGYSNPEVDNLFNQVKTKEALDKEVRKQIYAKLAKLLSEDLPVDFLMYSRGNQGFQKNVMGIEPGPSIGYNYYLWYFEPVK